MSIGIACKTKINDYNQPSVSNSSASVDSTNRDRKYWGVWGSYLVADMC